MSDADEEVTIFFCAGISPNNEISNGLQEEPIKIQRQYPLILMTIYVLAVRVALKTSNGHVQGTYASAEIRLGRMVRLGCSLLIYTIKYPLPSSKFDIYHVPWHRKYEAARVIQVFKLARRRMPHATCSAPLSRKPALVREYWTAKGEYYLFNLICSLHDSGPPCGASGRASPAVPGPCGMHARGARHGERNMRALLRITGLRTHPAYLRFF